MGNLTLGGTKSTKQQRGRFQITEASQGFRETWRAEVSGNSNLLYLCCGTLTNEVNTPNERKKKMKGQGKQMWLLATSTFNTAGGFLETLAVRVRAMPACPNGHFWSCLPGTRPAFIWLGHLASLWGHLPGDMQGPRKIKNAILLLYHYFYEKIQFLFQFELQGAYFLSAQQPKERPPGLLLSEIAPGALAALFFPIGLRSSTGAGCFTAQITAASPRVRCRRPPLAASGPSELVHEDSAPAIHFHG